MRLLMGVMVSVLIGRKRLVYHYSTPWALHLSVSNRDTLATYLVVLFIGFLLASKWPKQDLSVL